MEMPRDKDQKRKESPYMEKSRDNDQKRCVYENRNAAPKSFFNFHSEKQITSFSHQYSISFISPMAYNTTASLDKLTCTDYVDFGKCQDRLGRFSWSKNDSNYLDVKLKFSKKNINKEFQVVQNLTTGESNFNQFMRLRHQLVLAAENFARPENLSPVLIPILSRNMDEQHKLVQKCG